MIVSYGLNSMPTLKNLLDSLKKQCVFLETLDKGKPNNTITYGTASASFLSTRCLKQLFNQLKRKRLTPSFRVIFKHKMFETTIQSIEKEKAYPETAYAIRKDFYMDDLLTGANSIEKLFKLKQDVTDI
ncbi:hypothetical protein QE152_g7583 [Popillia japonica]|uniref:Uncharacterized protein n=1 Tax=Popillia japonica TaxID=7064 RepID=A0AAW1MDH6_POPJA